MIGIYKYWKNLALAVALAGGMAGMAGIAQAQSYSHSTVRNAQEQLKNDGYYSGTVDGVEGPMTHAAIRKYQGDNNLTVNGRLDRETRAKLGLQTNTGEANRAENNNNNMPANSSNTGNYSTSTITAAQRALHQKGFYKGAINGDMTSETQAAIREYQKNSNLNVTGQLNQDTLNSLGVSK